MLAKGGKNYYGVTIGILMNESSFPRVPGEMGNAWTWDFPVLFKVVKGARFEKVVMGGLPEAELLQPYIDAAKELEEAGVKAITTNCGFVALYQDKIAEHISIPIFASSLLQIPLVYKMLPKGQIVGVMTVNSDTLTEKHLECAGALDTPKVIYGLQNEEEFTQFMREDRQVVDTEKCRADLVRVAERMCAEHPEVGAIVLECTNMPPWAKDIQEATGRPVFDICTLTNYVASAFLKEDPFGYM
ncbi:MAG: aspartate/glutamate racemase family protein [Lachnospiraceae bacterium]|nr:aspartate/glutamate racemase family protein [Lachnospiraceae bacterium]